MLALSYLTTETKKIRKEANSSKWQAVSLTLADFLRKTVNRQKFVQVSEGAQCGSNETYVQNQRN